MELTETTTEPAATQRGTITRALLFVVVAGSLLVVAYRTPLLPIPLAGILAVVTVVLLRGDGRSGATLGLEISGRRVAQLAAGAAAGVVLALIVVGVARLILPFRWESNGSFSPATAAFSLVFLLFANACEELVFRGYAFDLLVRALGPWRAQALVAVAFALFHVACGWPWLIALTATTAGSLLFGVVVLRWRSVPAAIGLHVMWNWTRDLFFQAPPTGSSLWAPLGVERWGASERATVQVLLVTVTLLACAAVAARTRRPRVMYTP